MLSGRTKADEPSAASALEAVTIFCHAGPAGEHGKPILPHHVQEAALLQAGLTGTHHLTLPESPPSLSPPAVLHVVQPRLPEARAPPAFRGTFSYATGPPLPV